VTDAQIAVVPIGDPQQRLYRWIDQQLEPAHGREPLRELALSHLNASDQLQEIARFSHVDDAGKLKADVYRTALEVVASWRHFQRFAVQSFFGDSDKAAAYYPLALADDTPAGGPMATEPANAIGVLKMQMRHNEVLAKINASVQFQMLEQANRQAQTAHAELDKLRADFAKLYRDSYELMDKRREYELERLKIEHGEQRKDRMASSVEAVLPRLVNSVSEKLGGPKLLAENNSTLELMLAAMLRGLDDTGFEKLCALFGPAEQLLLLEMYNKLVRKPASMNGEAKH
jgi:hypothetical protein